MSTATNSATIERGHEIVIPPTIAMPAAPDTREVIDGFPVHPAASVMPPMATEQFDELVASIADRGLGEPIEFQGDTLVEGRHRLKAIVRLRERGTPIEIRKQQWQPLPGETVAEYVQRKNVHRRHLTDAQRLQCTAELLLLADKERAERGQGVGRIRPGEVRNPAGRNQRSAMREEGETDSFLTSDDRSRNRLKTERSAAGRLAKQEKTSIHKARQAIKVQKHGTPEEIAAVKEGRTTQPEIVKRIDERQRTSAAGKPKPKPINHPFTPTTQLQQDLLAGWVRLLDNKVPVTERQQARADMRLILAAEDKAKTSAQPCPQRSEGSTKSVTKAEVTK